jgi:hypothetical protein
MLKEDQYEKYWGEELDLDELDAELYTAWKKLERTDYYSAQCLVAKSWRRVHTYLLGLEPKFEASGD